MTAKKLAEKYGVKVMKFRGEWHSYRGGEGQRVVEIAEACSLVTLAKRTEKALKNAAEEIRS